MSERSIRVNELILRELSHILRTRFREQTVAVTLTEVSVSPDLRSGRVYYSVLGDERAKIKARSFFTKEYRTLRQLVAQKVVLKYFPKINFIEDDSIARGNRVLDLLGELDGADSSLPRSAHDADPHDDAAFDDDADLFDDEGDTSDVSGEGDDPNEADDLSQSDASADAADAGTGKRIFGKGSGKKPGRKGGSGTNRGATEDTHRSNYVFDEDDLEYARDIEAESNLWGSLADDDCEPFDEQNDVEFEDDDLDVEEGNDKANG